MTTNAPADVLSGGRELRLDRMGQWVVEANQRLRPADGWLTALLLALNLMVVVWSVEKADWVSTPSLAFLILLATATGLVLSRIPVWGALILPLGLALGVLVITWQLTSYGAGSLALTDSADLWQRLGQWYTAAKSGDINLDIVPFAFALMSLTWLLGYLAAWMLFRYGRFWWAFILGGAGLLSNLTYLPDEASTDLLLYLFTALLLVARVQSVRRRLEWKRRSVDFDHHLGLLSIVDSLILAVVALSLAFMLPARGALEPTNTAYEYMRSPLGNLEDDFNRLFAGLPARRPIPYRVWDDVAPFQGTLQPTTTPVLQVNAEKPIYWKARTYGTYTHQGWISENTVVKPIGWLPTYAAPGYYQSRLEVSYSVTPNYTSRTLFVGGQIVGADRQVRIESYESPTYTINLTGAEVAEALPPPLALAASSLRQALQAGGPSPSRSSLEAGFAWDFRLVQLVTERGLIKQAVLAEVLPEPPDVLSVRAIKGTAKARQTYQVTSSVSIATPEELSGDGTEYPTWALARYTQLPQDLPQRVRDLAAQLTAGAATPYHEARAIEDYLRTLPYDLNVVAPPYRSDGVDHFLFTLRRGYSEYFASAMVVLLRSQGIPARLATGYTTGDKVPDQDVYIVTDSHSHGWVEVFFPGYGWVPFEPTPGAALPSVSATEGGEEELPETGSGGALEDDDLLFEDDFFLLEGATFSRSRKVGWTGCAMPFPGYHPSWACWRFLGL